MRAVAYQKSLPIEDGNALVDVDVPTPNPHGRDLLVQIQAVSVNPSTPMCGRELAPDPSSGRCSDMTRPV